MLAGLRHALRKVIARRAHAAALIPGVAHAAERPRLVHRRFRRSRPFERVLVRRKAGIELAAREMDVAAERPEPREEFRPVETRQ